jgi:hypothetical protein
VLRGSRETSSLKSLPYTFFGGHDRQTLFVSVEVSSPDDKFDTLGKSFLPLYKLQNQNFYFETAKDLDFTCLIDFFQEGSANKIME